MLSYLTGKIRSDWDRYRNWVPEEAPHLQALPEQELILQRSELGEDLSFQVLRPRENDPEKPERIFACRLEF